MNTNTEFEDNEWEKNLSSVDDRDAEKEIWDEIKAQRQSEATKGARLAQEKIEKRDSAKKMFGLIWFAICILFFLSVLFSGHEPTPLMYILLCTVLNPIFSGVYFFSIKD